MRIRILVLAVAALALSAGTALAKGGPPPKDPDHPSQSQGGKGQDPAKHAEKDADKAAKDAEKDAEKAAKDAEKDAAQAEKTLAKDTRAATKEQTKASAAAARAAAKEARFKRQTARQGYKCKGGTTHLVGVVTAIVAPTATTNGSITITVVKGNKAGRSAVGTTMTITLLAATEVVNKGRSTLAGLQIGDTVNLDTRTCTPRDLTPGDGITPAPELLVRKLFVRQ